jgi:hypothetical protein
VVFVFGRRQIIGRKLIVIQPMYEGPNVNLCLICAFTKFYASSAENPSCDPCVYKVRV